MLYFYLSIDINHIIIICDACFGKSIFSLLFFEHGYLSNDWQCILDIWEVSSKHFNLVKCVSEFLFYDKKQETFMLFFYIIFLDFIK